MATNPPIEKLSTSEVLTRLRAKYSDGGYAVLTEVGDATGAKQKRWADAITMCVCGRPADSN